LAKLTQAAEKAKKVLSTIDETPLEVENVGDTDFRGKISKYAIFLLFFIISKKRYLMLCLSFKQSQVGRAFPQFVEQGEGIGRTGCYGSRIETRGLACRRDCGRRYPYSLRTRHHCAGSWWEGVEQDIGLCGICSPGCHCHGMCCVALCSVVVLCCVVVVLCCVWW